MRRGSAASGTARRVAARGDDGGASKLVSFAPHTARASRKVVDERPAVVKVSHEAIQLALASADSNTRQLSKTLYLYNRLPPPRGWRDRLSDAVAVARFLGLGNSGELPGNARGDASVMPRDVSATADGADWLFWGSAPHDLHGAGAKVYVCPHPEDLPETLRVVAESLRGSGASGMKVGADAMNLLRPDKCIVYFASVDDAARFGRGAASRFAGVRAQPAPFTTPLDADGFVSLGFDPPRPLGLSGYPPSWRAWVTERVARGILEARRTGRRSRMVPSVVDVLEHVRRLGVDPDSWTPTTTLWAL